MTTIRVKENEPFDVALRRFKRTIEKLGLLTELRAREDFAKRELTRVTDLIARGAATTQGFERASMDLRGLRPSLAQLDAAALGLPGRTITVGRRMLRPSKKPLRV